MNRGARIACGAGTAGALVLAWLVFGGAGLDGATAGAAAAARASRSGAPGQAALPAGISPSVASALPGLSADAVDAALAVSSLRGSSADGDWGIDAAGRFRPSRELRRRFDYYLALQGEVPLDELQRWVEAQLRRSHGAAGAAQVMPVFAAYLRLQQHPWRTAADPQRPQTLGPALAERQQVRRELLGMEVAQAFYRDDDAALEALIAQANGGGAPPAPAADEPGGPEHLPDAPARLTQWQRQWDDWERRVASARAEISRVQAAPELSPPQRGAAIEATLAQRFDPADRARARALLQLPPE